MILLESKDLSLTLSFLSVPSPFGLGKNLTVVHYRELLRELMLAGQLETSLRRDDSWVAEDIHQFADVPKLSL